MTENRSPLGAETRTGAREQQGHLSIRAALDGSNARGARTSPGAAGKKPPARPPASPLPGSDAWDAADKPHLRGTRRSPQAIAALHYAVPRVLPADPGWTWRVFPCKPRSKEPLTPHGYKDASANTPQLVQWWKEHPDANVAACPGHNGCIGLDVDRRAGGVETAQRLGLLDENGQPAINTLICETPNGWHFYFRHPGGQMGNVSLGPGVDVRADAGYLLLPPSIHPSGKPYRWRPGWDGTVADLPPHILELLRAKNNGATSDAPAREIPTRAVIPEGDRNNELTRYGGRLVAKGLDPAEVVELVHALNATKCAPPLPSEEVQRIVDSIGGAETRNHPERALVKPPPYRLLTLDDLARLPEPSWLVEGLIPTGALGFLIGKYGSGKSFLALDLVLCLATGRLTWFGRTLQPCGVLYAAGEGVSSLKQRVDAWMLDNAGGGEAHVAFCDRVPNLLDRASVTAFIQAIKDRIKEWSVPLGLLVIDTLSRAVAGADENSAQDMSRAVEHLDLIRRELGCDMLVLHHPGKDATRGARGSSALEAAADVVLTLESVDGVRTLRVTKLRDGDPDQRLTFRLVPAGDSVTVAPVDAGELPACRTKAEDDALAALERLGKPAKTAEWHQATGSMAQTTFYRARKALVASGLVVKTAAGYSPKVPRAT